MIVLRFGMQGKDIFSILMASVMSLGGVLAGYYYFLHRETNSKEDAKIKD